MADNLKNRIEENLNEFEIYPFDVEQGWSEIANRVRQPHSSRWKVWYAVAASVVVLLLAGLGYQQLDRESEEGNSELSETQIFYQQQIDAKMVTLKGQLEDPELFEDLEAMDQAFAELKADLKDGAQNEQLVEAMIDNYRLKLEILERILEDIEAEKDEEDINL